jgi:hypothetical protein
MTGDTEKEEENEGSYRKASIQKAIIKYPFIYTYRITTNDKIQDKNIKIQHATVVTLTETEFLPLHLFSCRRKTTVQQRHFIFKKS